MAEDLQPMTLRQRIAALNQAHIGRVPGEPPLPTQRAYPQIPSRRPVITKSKTVNNPPEQNHGSVTNITIGNQPAALFPPPLPGRKVPPPLPKRKTLDPESRRGSEDSTKSTATTDTDSSRLTLSRNTSNESNPRVKAPAWGEIQLPELPSRGAVKAPRKYSSEKPKYVNRVPAVITIVSTTAAATPALDNTSSVPSRPIPPKLPSRKTQIHHEDIDEKPMKYVPPVPTAETLEKVKRSALSFGLNKQPPVVREPVPEVPQPNEAEAASIPPPIPLSSRPDLSAIHATKPKLSNSTSAVNGSTGQISSVCLVCRDFSAPDYYATLFPRAQVTSLQSLALQLTSPFASPTDKVRVIFTWLHHNIAYDVVNFSRGTIKPSTPQSTLQSGLAVCEGYAALFTNLASYAGLESIVISGYGKGYGYIPLAQGSPIPPYESNHAWNAVKIDNGEWKLIDCTWGAGYGSGSPLVYTPRFDPFFFSMPNEEFGIKHFPTNKDHFFLPLGTPKPTWEEYIQINPSMWPHNVERPTVFTDAKEEFGIGETTFFPQARYIKVNQQQGSKIRFQFSLICPHWTLEGHQKRGPAPVFIISTFGGGNDHVPLEHIPGNKLDGGGDLWYADIPVQKLGTPGQTVTLFWIKSFGDRDNARGLTVKEFLQGKGRTGMNFQGVAAWELV